jgi:hypothetical protein
VSRTSKPPVKSVSDAEVRALLDRYRCPVPFHLVRTRFLGGIATPTLLASPMDTVLGLWNGELPKFDGLAALNEFSAVLVMGLWNRLTQHQERNSPFQLVRADIPETREGLAGLSLIRREEELDGFIHGLFGKEESLKLPERAHQTLTALSEMRAMLEGLRVVASDPTKPATFDDIAQALDHVRELTRISEREIHEAVMSCTQIRRQTSCSILTATHLH